MISDRVFVGEGIGRGRSGLLLFFICLFISLVGYIAGLVCFSPRILF